MSEIERFKIIAPISLFGGILLAPLWIINLCVIAKICIISWPLFFGLVAFWTVAHYVATWLLIKYL